MALALHAYKYNIGSMIHGYVENFRYGLDNIIRGAVIFATVPQNF